MAGDGPRYLRFVLGQDDERRVRDFLPGRAGLTYHLPPVVHLLDEWIDFVSDVERGFDGNLYDYTLHLLGRTTLRQVSEIISAEKAEELSAFLTDADELFRSVTRELARPLLRYDEWWWRRIPVVLVGELAEHVASDGVRLSEEPS